MPGRQSRANWMRWWLTRTLWTNCSKRPPGAPGGEPPDGHRQEGPRVVAADAEAPEKAPENAEAAPEAARAQPSQVHRVSLAAAERVRLGMGVPRVEELGLVHRRDAAPPHVQHGVIRREEVHVGLAPSLPAQPARALEPCPQWRLRQGVEDVDGEDGDPRRADEVEDPVGRRGGGGGEP